MKKKGVCGVGGGFDEALLGLWEGEKGGGATRKTGIIT